MFPVARAEPLIEEGSPPTSRSLNVKLEMEDKMVQKNVSGIQMVGIQIPTVGKSMYIREKGTRKVDEMRANGC